MWGGGAPPPPRLRQTGVPGGGPGDNKRQEKGGAPNPKRRERSPNLKGQGQSTIQDKFNSLNGDTGLGNGVSSLSYRTRRLYLVPSTSFKVEFEKGNRYPHLPFVTLF